MKRIISIFLVVLMLFSVATVSAFAQTTITPDPNNLFEEILLEKYSKNIVPSIYEYRELEYHYNEQGEIDWALVYAIYDVQFGPDFCYAIACGRVWTNIDLYGPQYAVYDVEKQSLEFVFSADWSKYDGLREAVDRADIGRPIGDANYNRKLEITDATFIQRVLAELENGFHPYDFIDGDMYHIFMSDENIKYFSDFNRDGDRNILDATAIQMHLAQLDIPVDTPVEG
ncbi:MAG: hypothetical protein E7513_02600 [Ruminococcaceae bacterium]|nr:hypothetical protein [Oscillospiraceae bacterium]